jgi:hypothetical protein
VRSSSARIQNRIATATRHQWLLRSALAAIALYALVRVVVALMVGSLGAPMTLAGAAVDLGGVASVTLIALALAFRWYDRR